MLAGAFVGGIVLCNTLSGINAASTKSFTKNEFNGNGGSYVYLKNKQGGTALSATKTTSLNPAILITGIWDTNGNNKMDDWNYVRVRPISSSAKNVSSNADGYTKIKIDENEWDTIETTKNARAQGMVLKAKVQGNSSKGGKISGNIQFN